jgi:hypothetical protein
MEQKTEMNYKVTWSTDPNRDDCSYGDAQFLRGPGVERRAAREPVGAVGSEATMEQYTARLIFRDGKQEDHIFLMPQRDPITLGGLNHGRKILLRFLFDPELSEQAGLPTFVDDGLDWYV